MINLTLNAEAQDDKLTTRLNWGNNTAVTYSGEIATVTNFFKRNGSSKGLNMRVGIQPSHIIINDTVWTLNQSDIAIDSSRVAINDFRFEHGNQHLHINGNLTPDPEDSLCIDLHNIRLEYIFDIIQFKPVDFRGVANGKAYVKHALEKTITRCKPGHQQFHVQWRSYGRYERKRKMGCRRRKHLSGC